MLCRYPRLKISLNVLYQYPRLRLVSNVLPDCVAEASVTADTLPTTDSQAAESLCISLPFPIADALSITALPALLSFVDVPNLTSSALRST